MKEIGDRLREVREEAGYKTATDAARRFGWNENTYRSNENGQREPGREAAIEYARAFRVSVDWLLTGRGLKRSPTGGSTPTGTGLRHIPRLRWSDVNDADTLLAAVGTAEPQGYVVVPESESLSPDAFALDVQDDSMVDPDGSRLSLYRGDTVIIDPHREPQPGSVVLAKEGHRRIIRKLRLVRPGVVALVPLNPDYDIREISARDVEGVIAGSYRRSE